MFQKVILIIFLLCNAVLVLAQENKYSKVVECFDNQDYENTIKTIEQLRSEAIITRANDIVLDYFLQSSYFFLEDDRFQPEKLEESISTGVFGELYVLLARNILGAFYSETANYEKFYKNNFYFLLHLSQSYYESGDFGGAIEMAKSALEGINDYNYTKEEYLNVLHQLIILYDKIGDLDNAIKITNIILKQYKEYNKEFYLFEMTYLALLYLYNNQRVEADAVIAEVLEDSHFEKELNPVFYSNLSVYFAGIDKLGVALVYGERALELAESCNDAEYPLSVLYNMSAMYGNLGEFEIALETVNRAFKIMEEIDLKNSEDFSHILTLLAFLNLINNNFSDSYFFLERFYDHTLNYRIKSVLVSLSESEKAFNWEKNKFHIVNAPYYHYYSNYNYFKNVAYNSILFSKGMLLQSSIELNKLLMESGDEEVINKAEDLRILRATLNKQYEKPISERHLNTDSLEQISSKLEKDLLSMSKEYGDYTRFMDVNWEDVQEKLSEKDVAVEIVEFPVFKSDSVMYAAMVLRKYWEQPQMIPLFEKKEIVSFLDQTPSKQYAGYVGKQLYKLMWKPLESVVEEGDNVYFSPSGVYHQLAMEYLPAEEGTPLCDIYNMHRLSSTRQLVVENRDVAHKQAVLYGGIRYDVEGDEMLAESKKYQQDESLYAQRGMTVDSLRGSQWVSLANTIPEVNFISGELEKHGIKSKVYSDTEANEESIKSLSGKKVNILHLATHGFFLPIEETKKVEFYQMMGMDNNPAPDLSMRRSGLIMAGGNGVWTGKSIPEGVDDGVLTAQEISVLDFREMDMVVLSACETALGDIDTSEGVFGLQRAFKKAGVNTLLMSLWKVNDEVTKTLMNKFYQTLLSGKSKREAFLEAQRFVRNSHPDPKDWAAFVMVD